MILDQCKNPDGTTDWKKYNELQRQETERRKSVGEICRRNGCTRFITLSRGYPQTCTDCLNLDKPTELHHPSDVRCPKCGYHWRIGDDDDYEVYKDGTHDLTCAQCETKFEVTTWVTYTFVSPARLKEEKT